MKRNRDSDALAARLAAAGNQPPVVLAFAPAAETAKTDQAEPVAPEPPETVTTPVEDAKARKARRTKAALDAEKEDTVPISLRPPRALLTRYVAAASERSLESGRVISAQQIMLEVLERGP